jgi:integrase
LRLPESKTGAKVIVLNAPAREILANLPHVQGNPYVFPGNKEGAHLVNIQKPWRKLRKQAGLDDLRIHDLRHSFASFGVSAGMSLPMIGKLLGHTQPQTTARYAHLADDPVRAATEQIGATVADALSGNGTKR